MKTYEERTQAVLDMVEKKRRRRRAIVATVSSVVPCLVILMVTLAVFLPTAGGLSSDKSVEMAADRSSSSPYGESAANGNPKADSSVDQAPLYDHPTEQAQAGADTREEPSAIAELPALPTRVDSYAALTDLVETVKDTIGRENIHYVNGRGYYQGNEYYVQNQQIDWGVYEHPKYEGTASDGAYVGSDDYFCYLTRFAGEADAYEEKVGNQVRTYYHARRLRIRFYRKAGLETALAATFEFAPFGQDVDYIDKYAMSVLDDGKTAFVTCYGTGGHIGGATAVFVLDVSDIEHVVVKEKRVLPGGNYVSSRVIDGRLFLQTAHFMSESAVDPDDPSTFVPYVLDGDRKILVAPTEIDCMIPNYNYQYTALTMFDENLSILGQSAVMVSPVTYPTSVCRFGDGRVYIACLDQVYRATRSGLVTQIACLAFDRNSLHLVGTVEVEGCVQSQEWLSEEAGVLRVVSEGRNYRWSQYEPKGYYYGNGIDSVILTSVSAADRIILDACKHLRTESESLFRVRLDRQTAYVCTARAREEEPLLAFDLSDSAHITCTDEGTLPGFYSSLIPFVGDTLLGIGGKHTVEEYMVTAMDLYRVEEGELGKIAEAKYGRYEGLQNGYEITDGWSGYSCVVDRERGLIGGRFYYYKLQNTKDENGNPQQETERKAYFILTAYRDGELRTVKRVDVTALQGANVMREGSFVYLYGDGGVITVDLDQTE